MKTRHQILTTACALFGAAALLFAADPPNQDKQKQMPMMKEMMKDKGMMREMCREMMKDPDSMKIMCEEMMKNEKAMRTMCQNMMTNATFRSMCKQMIEEAEKKSGRQ